MNGTSDFIHFKSALWDFHSLTRSRYAGDDPSGQWVNRIPQQRLLLYQ